MKGVIQKIYYIIGAIAILFVIVALIILYFQKRETVTIEPELLLEIEQRLKDLPPPGEEPAEVFFYNGQVKKIDTNNKQIIMATIYGPKTVGFNEETKIFLVDPPDPTPGPPPRQAENQQEIAKNMTNINFENIDIADKITAESLTNIRGLANFIASNIFIIKN